MSDLAACGRWAGVLLVQNLADLVDGIPPMNSPVGGVGRFGDEERFSAVHFPNADREAFEYMVVGPGTVRRWIGRETLCDAALIRHLPEESELHVLVPWCDGRDWFELVVWFRYAIAGGAVQVSMPNYQIEPSSDSGRFHELIDGMDLGISSHPRCAELEAAWGALGDYLHPLPGPVDPSIDALYDSLVALGRQRGRHRLWRGAVTYDEVEQAFAGTDLERLAMAPHFAVLGKFGVTIVYQLDEM